MPSTDQKATTVCSGGPPGTSHSLSETITASSSPRPKRERVRSFSRSTDSRWTRPLGAAANGALRMPEDSLQSRIALQPGHERGVDDVGHALAADGADREIHVLQSEAVGRDSLQREALRGDLRERELARLPAVAARALDGDRLGGDLADGEVGKLRELPLHDHRAGLAPERLDSEQHRHRSRARRAVEHDVHALAAGDLANARERILLVHVD